MHKLALLLFVVLSPFFALAQASEATITGKVLDSDQQPIELATVTIKGLARGVRTNAKGEFSLSIPADRNVILVFSYIGYNTKYITKRLKANQMARIVVSLERYSTVIKDIKIDDKKEKRREAGNIVIDPNKARLLPTPINGIESLLKFFVGSNNETTSQYNVRGGNYDENLVYINDFEVYRPFLVRSGQQEGLSIINPDLTAGVSFSTGGFQSKYGDKMSSVLDITYKRPTEFAGSVQLSLLGVNAHLEGTGLNGKLSYLIGARQKSNQYFLQSQQTQGIYNPTFTDIQTFANYKFNNKWQMDLFLNYARNRFDFQPESSTQSFGLINQAFQLRMFYNGAETDKFDSRFGGISFTNTPNNRLSLKFLASGFQTQEQETYDIQGEYLLGEIETDLGKDNFGQLKYAIGTGQIHTYARNYLNINVGDIGHKGSYDAGKHFIQWGANAKVVYIDDKLNEWERRDSAGYSQPFSDSALYMFRRYKTTQAFSYQQLSAFVQDNVAFDSGRAVITGGIRFNYNTLNGELLASPRLQFSYNPRSWKNDVIFRAATGLYSQPPFYREMRDLEGNVNKDLKAQKSLHAVAGFDYNFKGISGRPFKLTTELYYKKMWDLVPYEFDNVRIRYFGENASVGYAYGAEFRLFGDIVPGAESWVSLGLMKSGEDIINDRIDFQDVNGADSATVYPGYIPRPTDSRINFGLFFSDYLPRNENFKVNLSGLYGTGLPFGPPDANRFGDTLRIPSYKRVDIGFSALLLDGEKKERPHYSFFRNFKSVWLSMEVFNLLGIRNTLSYLWIQDQTSGRTYAVPNRLTARLLNARMIVEF